MSDMILSVALCRLFSESFQDGSESTYARRLWSDKTPAFERIWQPIRRCAAANPGPSGQPGRPGQAPVTSSSVRGASRCPFASDTHG